MSKKTLLFALLSLFSGGVASAIDGGSYGAYSPYSVYGIGEQFNPGTAYNWTMGGVGVASRNNRYMNIINPAAVTARDTLSFMSDFSFYQTNRIYRQSDILSANNNMNMLNFAISFPVTSHTAMALCIRPYSSIGYSFTEYTSDPKVIGTIGTIGDSYSGQGGVYEVSASFGGTIFKRLSLGAEGKYFFGSIGKSHSRVYSESAALAYSQSSDCQLNAAALKFGIQYNQTIGTKTRICAGATYQTEADIKGTLYNQTLSGNASLASDTVRFAANGPRLASEAAFGISVNYMDKFRAEVDFSLSDWTGCRFNEYEGLCANRDAFVPCMSNAVRIGVEYIPNRSDIRYYWKRVTYRAGFYNKTEGYKVFGLPVATTAVTAGVTLPVFRWSNGLTLGMEAGRRGTVRNNLVSETFVNFCIGVNLYDIWFQQPRYE